MQGFLGLGVLIEIRFFGGRPETQTLAAGPKPSTLSPNPPKPKALRNSGVEGVRMSGASKGIIGTPRPL